MGWKIFVLELSLVFKTKSRLEPCGLKNSIGFQNKISIGGMWVEALEIGNLRKLLATEILKIGVECSIGRGSDLYIRGLAGEGAKFPPG